MDLKDVVKNLSSQDQYTIVQRIERLLRVNPKYRNLDDNNKKVILDIIERYKKLIRRGIKPSRLIIKKDRYRLYRNRIKLGLSPTDLKQIFDLLESFHKK